MEYLMRRGRQYDGKIGPNRSRTDRGGNGRCRCYGRKDVSGQMDDRAEQAVFGGRRRRRVRLGGDIGRTMFNRPDSRLRSWPADGLPAMHVIVQYN
jgi:hypothetical protein